MVRIVLLLNLMYLLMAFPILKVTVFPETHRHARHHHNCHCGCNGDVTQCTCEAASGIVGFRYCSIQLNGFLPLLPLWTTRDLEIAQTLYASLQSQNYPAEAPILLAQEVYPDIDHPPNVIS